ncbi:major capsid protein [Capybara microvirus Cap1_SP_158]|nr:major capsid protein [Capybara microvirus Cap1_SP_158]
MTLNRNQNSHLTFLPKTHLETSTFDMSHQYITTCNAGDLVPHFWVECLPGDRHVINTASLARMQSLLTAPFSDMYLEQYYFFVPTRLLQDSWQSLIAGESKYAWLDDSQEHFVSQLTFHTNVQAEGDNYVKTGCLLDYLGVPIARPASDGGYVASISAHIPSAYCLIWNEWFRDVNLQDAAEFNTLEENREVHADGSAFHGGKLLKVSKYRDRITTCLPSPQRGPDVHIALSALAPVTAMAESHSLDSVLKFGALDGTTFNANTKYDISGAGTGSNNLNVISTPFTGQESGAHQVAPSNLYADLSKSADVTINQLRESFQLQRYYERLALSGNRYKSYLLGIFGVESSDARLQRPEYIGGSRTTISVDQVVQNSATTDQSPQGNIAAYSLTRDYSETIEYSCEEHGYIIGVYAIRYPNVYQDGLPRAFMKKDKFDFYIPQFAHLGEQPIYNKEVFLGTSAQVDDEVFGYQEAWSDYRFGRGNMVTSEMRSRAPLSLDCWHLADDYDSLPYLSADWIQLSSGNVDRVLAVSERVSNQFLCDFFFNHKAHRPMPLYSVPGMIDHF